MSVFLAPPVVAALPAVAKTASILTPSLISGGASLLGGLINAGSQLGTNSSQLSYSREMYDKQRADALADWKMQNEYNSPSAQMARFKEAGLNPNLIYGQMTNAPVVRTSSAQSYSPTAPQIDLGGTANMAINQYYDSQLKNATIDNVKAQADANQQIALLKAMEVLKESKNVPMYEGLANANANMRFNEAAMKGEEYEQFVEFKDLRKKSLVANIDSVISATQLSNENKIKVQTEIENLKKTGELQKLEIDMRKAGIAPNDPLLLRIIAQGLPVGDWIQKAKTYVKSKLK